MGEQPPKVPAQTIRVPIQEVVKQNRIRIKNLEVNLQALQNDFAELVAFVNAGGEPDPEPPPGQGFQDGDDPPDPSFDGTHAQGEEGYCDIPEEES